MNKALKLSLASMGLGAILFCGTLGIFFGLGPKSPPGDWFAFGVATAIWGLFAFGGAAVFLYLVIAMAVRSLKPPKQEPPSSIS